MSLRPYPRYKPSGIDWLGNVPEHWTTPPLYARYQVDLGKMLDAGRITGECLLSYLRNVDVQWDTINVAELPEMDISPVELNRYTVKEGDLLVCEGGEVGRAAIVPAQATGLGFQKALHRVRPRRNTEVPRFLYYTLFWASESGVFIADGNLNTISHLTAEKLRRYRFPCPPLAEQSRIANLLDAATAKFDTLIQKKRALVEKLQEKRSVLISRVVLRGLPPEPARAAGLNPQPRFKPSGIDWVGEIPEHWRAAKLRRFARMKTGHTPSRQHSEYWEDCEIPWFTLADVWQLRDETRYFLGDTQEKISHLGLANSAAELLPAATVILSRTASVGFSGIMPEPMATSQDFWNWVCGKELLPKYLLFLFRAMRKWLSALMMGSTHPTIYQAQAAGLAVCIPPLGEQQAIVDFLDCNMAKIGHMIEKVEEAIGRLQEYRTAFITAAVTGKIDLREDIPVTEPAMLVAAG